MKLAFLLFRYFPYGGLQRDCLAIAESLAGRGHSVHLLTRRWEGPSPRSVAHLPIESGGLANHRRLMRFGQAAARHVAAEGFDGVVGFDRLPGLDLYYAGARCYAAAAARHGPLYRLTPRYRCHATLERAIFAPESATQILLLAEAERAAFRRHYGTSEKRFHLLPPGIDRRLRRPADALARRSAQRQALGLTAEDRLLLLVGSRFRTKGVDRAIRALAALQPSVRLLVLGSDRPGRMALLARALGVAGRVRFLGGESDILPYLLAADLLVHPARSELTGTVILEAIVAGLPVLCSGACGYAEHVLKAGAGLVLPEPFDQRALGRTLREMLESPLLPQWQRQALDYAARADLYEGRARAALLIERLIGARTQR